MLFHSLTTLSISTLALAQVIAIETPEVPALPTSWIGNYSTVTESSSTVPDNTLWIGNVTYTPPTTESSTFITSTQNLTTSAPVSTANVTSSLPHNVSSSAVPTHSELPPPINGANGLVAGALAAIPVIALAL